jgi:hypothetical protein
MCRLLVVSLCQIADVQAADAQQMKALEETIQTKLMAVKDSMLAKLAETAQAAPPAAFCAQPSFKPEVRALVMGKRIDWARTHSCPGCSGGP